MAGEWIQEKARGLMGIFPGAWEEISDGVFQGRCPGESCHSHASAVTDCRVFLTYSPDGKKPPGIYCCHKSCKPVLEDLNRRFRDELFAKTPSDGPREPGKNPGVVVRPPREREAWIPEFDIAKLRATVAGVPEVTEEWFMERSPIDPRKVGPGEFIEYVFEPGERVIVFTEFKGPGDFLWQVGSGGFRLSDKRGVSAVRSALPTDGGRDGAWYLCNPVDGKWYPNPRREGKYSRRSAESVTAWRHVVLECDEEKTLKAMAQALRDAHEWWQAGCEDWKEPLKLAKRPKWAEEVAKKPDAMAGLAVQYEKDAPQVPGLWMRFLAMCGLELVALYTSGGYSLHGLWRVKSPDKASLDAFLSAKAKRSLPRVGADPAAMTPVRLTRLPGVSRNGRMQKLIYLNPKAGTVPIVDMPRVRRVSSER